MVKTSKKTKRDQTQLLDSYFLTMLYCVHLSIYQTLPKCLFLKINDESITHYILDTNTKIILHK